VVAQRSKLATICGALNDAGARYVLIGARALNLWGGTRATRDVDVLIEATAENAQRVLEALAVLGFVLVRDLDPVEVASHPVTVVGDLWHVDIFTVAWSVRYVEAKNEAHVFEVDGVAIPTVSIRHLIASKRTDRLQDAADIEVLEEIQKRLG
jgi:predicted nucleotidyltransferase